MPNQSKLPLTWEQMTEQERRDYELYDQLCSACYGKKGATNIAEIDRLLDAGAKAYNSTWEQQHHAGCLDCLFLAARWISFEEFIHIFDRFCVAGLDYPKIQETPYNPLHYAIYRGHIKIAAWLIEKK